MKTLDEIQRVQRTYRHGISTLLLLGGIGHLAPLTEREWVQFNCNQYLRDRGIGKPLPWPEHPNDTINTAEDLLAALEDAAAKA